MAHYAITAIGADRPGIVAAIAEALAGLGGNLEDVSSTIMRGHFAMMLVADVPAEGGRLRSALEAAARPLGVEVHVADVKEASPHRPRATHVLTAYGGDRPGIVARFAGSLAERGINVTDLTCRRTGGEEPVYVMVAEVAVPEDVDAGRLATDVGRVGEELGVDAALRPIEVETL